MSARQEYPSSVPFQNSADVINRTRRRSIANEKAIARGALPEPLLFRVTPVAPGPPPTFKVEIVNPMTGGFIILGTI